MSVEIDEGIARRVLAAVDAGFVPELGEPIPLRRLVHNLHGARWSSPHAQARGLRHLIVAALGSKGVVDEIAFAGRVARLAIQWCVPTALRAVAQFYEGAQRERILQAAALCEREPTREHARVADATFAAPTYANLDGGAASDAGFYAASTIAWGLSAAAAAARAARLAAADARGDAVVSPAAYAGVCATYAATNAVGAATYAAGAAAAATEATGNGAPNDVAARAAYDDALAAFAERVVHVLIDMGSPGAAYLYLTDR